MTVPLFLVRGAIFLVAMCVVIESWSYELPNHADMSETAALKSILFTNRGPSGKLFRLGLRQREIADPSQTFPLDIGLPTIGLCYGIKFDANGKVVADDATGSQPSWVGTNGNGPQLTIAQLIRYGACFEDAVEPNPRSLAHFYDPQNGGASAPFGPSSVDWMLTRNTANRGKTGINHYTWMDARASFYWALTGKSIDPDYVVTNVDPRYHWARTFQALGHVIHHLQDMAQPQHVRGDAHCDEEALCLNAYLGVSGLLGYYKPSVYEKYLLDRFQFVRNLAALANTPMVFGLPKEFWSMDGDSFNGMIA